ncbi:TIGR00282 family metallophosphoesterase [bacterium]|nr:TIGR00282 family metallophosphoesterase [bacterium]
MRLLFIGDIMGEAGRKMVQTYLPILKEKHSIDMVCANGENMAGGFGFNERCYLEMCQAGVDVMTGGNHSFDKKEGYAIIEEEEYLLRPDNYPDKLPGKGHTLYTTPAGIKVAVFNLMGRIFMDPLDCPFQRFDKLYEQYKDKANIVIVDFHAEATSEKVAFGWFTEGRASLVVGTHTHVQTADERIFPGGTAFICDLGMTGPYDSVIGVKKEPVIEKFVLKRGKRFEPASGDPWLCGVLVDIDEKTGKALKIERIRLEASKNAV